MGGQKQNYQLSGWIFQLLRAVRIICRRLPQTSINGEYIREMMSLIRHMEYLELQLENPLVRQNEYIVFLLWKATREIDFWVLILKEINVDSNLEISTSCQLTHRIRENLIISGDGAFMKIHSISHIADNGSERLGFKNLE